MSIFSKIIAGEIPSYKIAESDMFYAFLDIFPLQKRAVSRDFFFTFSSKKTFFFKYLMLILERSLF
jgi:hypothetical protein